MCLNSMDCGLALQAPPASLVGNSNSGVVLAYGIRPVFRIRLKIAESYEYNVSYTNASHCENEN